MSEGHAEWQLRCEMCKQQAHEAMELAGSTSSETERAGLVLIATEWLKLAEEIAGSVAS